MEQIIHNFIAEWGLWGVFLIIMVDNANIPLPPTEFVLTLTGWFIARNVFDFTEVFIVSTIAGTIGCFIFYCAIRYAQDFFMPKLQKWLRISDEKLEKAINFSDRYGGWGVFLGRLIPGMRTISMIPSGLFKYSIPKFIMFTLAGTAIWNFALLYLGLLAAKAIE